MIFLKNSNATGFADISIYYGIGGDKPIAGGWDGDGIDSIGVSGDLPIAGNWDGKP